MQPQGVQVASGTLAERNRIESVHKTGRSMEAAIPQHVRGGPWCTFSRSSRQQCHAQVEGLGSKATQQQLLMRMHGRARARRTSGP